MWCSRWWRPVERQIAGAAAARGPIAPPRGLGRRQRHPPSLPLARGGRRAAVTGRRSVATNGAPYLGSRRDRGGAPLGGARQPGRRGWARPSKLGSAARRVLLHPGRGLIGHGAAFRSRAGKRTALSSNLKRFAIVVYITSSFHLVEQPPQNSPPHFLCPQDADRLFPFLSTPARPLGLAEQS